MPLNSYEESVHLFFGMRKINVTLYLRFPLHLSRDNSKPQTAHKTTLTKYISTLSPFSYTNATIVTLTIIVKEIKFTSYTLTSLSK